MGKAEEVTIRKELGGYWLPDGSIDIAAWLRDGLEVYNLFVLMKPMFFQMLEAHGGEFSARYDKINGDGKRWSLTMGERVPEGGDSITDREIFATLVERDQSEDPLERQGQLDIKQMANAISGPLFQRELEQALADYKSGKKPMERLAEVIARNYELEGYGRRVSAESPPEPKSGTGGG